MEAEQDLQHLLTQRERQIEAIGRVSEALFAHPNIEAMIRETLKIALDVLNAEAGTVYLHDPQTDTLVFRYVIGGSGEQLIGTSIPASKGIAGAVFRSGQPRLDKDVQSGGDYNADVENRYGYHTENMMTVPIKRTGAPSIGVMQVLNAHLPPFTPSDLEVLSVLCAQAAMGIEHYRVVESARKAEIVNVIGDISHDIKNMLTPILTGVWTLEPMLDQLFVDLDEVRNRCTDEGATTAEISAAIQQAADQTRYDYGWMLQNALNSAEQVQSRTKEIADAVKGELTEPVFQEANLNESCELVVQTLKTVAAKAKVNLLLDLDAALPVAQIDRKQIYNAVYNLVNNALPETPAGGSVTVRTRSSENNTILLQVADTGRGIPEDIRQRLFTDEAVSTKPGGTGLGTRIVMGVVRRHNGTITVDSEVGQGATFTICLPLTHV